MVLTPPQGIQFLVWRVLELNLHAGIVNSLDAKLQSALAALDDLKENNDGAAINKLQAFINEVEAQRGGKLTEGQADESRAFAQNVIDLIIGP